MASLPQASASCRARQEAQVATGVGCYLSSHRKTLLPSGEERMLPSSSLFDRCAALLMDREVDALVLAVHTDELLKRGLPIDAVAAVSVIDDEVTSHGGAGAVDGGKAINALHRLMDAYSLGSGASRTGREVP